MWARPWRWAKTAFFHLPRATMVVPWELHSVAVSFILKFVGAFQEMRLVFHYVHAEGIEPKTPRTPPPGPASPPTGALPRRNSPPPNVLHPGRTLASTPAAPRSTVGVSGEQSRRRRAPAGALGIFFFAPHQRHAIEENVKIDSKPSQIEQNHSQGVICLVCIISGYKLPGFTV